MAQIKWSAFPSGSSLQAGDQLVGLRSGDNVRFSGPVSIPFGGTGLSTLTSYNIIAAGTTATGAFQQLAAGTAGQILQSAGAGALATWANISSSAVSSLTGTANQVLVNATSAVPTTGAITLTLPQDIASTSSPTFDLMSLNNLVMVPETINLDDTFPTIDLLASSSDFQIIICADSDSGGQINLPDATTLVKGRKFTFTVSSVNNPQKGQVTIASQSFTYFAQLPTEDATVSTVVFTLIDNGTADGIWDEEIGLPTGNLPLPVPLGGTGISSLTVGAMLYAQSTSLFGQVGSIPGAGTFGGMLTFGNGTGVDFATAPSQNTPYLSGGSAGDSGGWATWRFSTPSTNGIMYWSSLNLQSSTAAANSATLVTNSSGVPLMSSTMTNGQVIIGSTGATPTAATLTAGAGISITNGAASITIASTDQGLQWAGVAGTTQTAAVGTGYIIQNASITTISLPTTFAIGDIVAVQGLGAGGWILAAAAGDTIQVGSVATSAGGTVASANQWNSIEIVGVVANTTWAMRSSVTAGFTTT